MGNFEDVPRVLVTDRWAASRRGAVVVSARVNQPEADYSIKWRRRPVDQGRAKSEASVVREFIKRHMSVGPAVAAVGGEGVKGSLCQGRRVHLLLSIELLNATDTPHHRP